MASAPSFFKKYIYAILWAIAVLIACGWNGHSIPKIHWIELFHEDKPVHAIMFGLQAWLIIKARIKYEYGYKVMDIVLWACIVSTVYGVLIEVAQKYWFIGRSFDYFDMIADAFGCVIVYFWFFRKRKQFAQ
jgi:hypothetical protein